MGAVGSLALVVWVWGCWGGRPREKEGGEGQEGRKPYWGLGVDRGSGD